jgi:2-polyprenyl-3-methyl-5-hydroxy-6-metoxy-1,4-benzoquinol methylase
MELIENIKNEQPNARTILDFGSGCGQNAIELAEAGYTVSMADYDGYTSQFAKFRAKQRGLDIKFYDIEKPINEKFDIILALHVLEYVPDSEFGKVIQLLKSLKSDCGKIIASANFGSENRKYPMRYEGSATKIDLIKGLNKD